MQKDAKIHRLVVMGKWFLMAQALLRGEHATRPVRVEERWNAARGVVGKPKVREQVKVI